MSLRPRNPGNLARTSLAASRMAPGGRRWSEAPIPRVATRRVRAAAFVRPLIWTARTPAATPVVWDAVAHDGSSTWAAVGWVNTAFATSSDGITWAAATSPPAFTYGARALGFGGSLWVAGGVGGNLATSPDADTWTLRTSGTSNVIQDVAHGDSIWVYVGNFGVLSTSSDGITWTAQTSSFGSDDVLAVAYNAVADVWVAVGGYAAGKIATSSDGTTWTQQTCPITEAVQDVAFGGGMWVAVGGAQIATSTDGVTWTLRTSPFGADWVLSVAYGDRWVVASEMGDVAESNNGVTWTTPAASTLPGVRSLAYGAGRWVAVGNDEIATGE